MADIRINSLPTTATSFNSDDYIAIDGTSAGTRKLLANNPPFSDVTLGSGGPSVKSTLSARAPRQGLVYDGTTNSSSTLASAIGTSDFTVSVPLTVLASNPAVARGIFSIGNFGNGQSFNVYLGTTGNLDIALFGTTGSDYRASGVTGFIAANANKTGLLTITRSGTTLTVYFNAVSQTLVAPSIGGTDPTWAGTITSTAVRHGNMSTATFFFVGYVGELDIYNRALSASEVVALYEAGAPSAADYNTAGTERATTNWVNASTAFTSFSSSGATAFTVTAGAGQGRAESRATFALSVGQRVRLTGSVASLSGTADCYLVTSGGTLGSAVTSSAVSANGSFTIDLIATATDSGMRVALGSSGAWSGTFTSLSLKTLGLLLAPDAAQAGGGLVWYDTSGNAANITLPASGVSWNVPSSRVLGGNWTTSGNLTVSGTGTSSILNIGSGVLDSEVVNIASAEDGSGISLRSTKTGGKRYFIVSTGGTSGYGQGKLVFGDETVGAYMTLASGGNLLLGTVIDGGQKLQVAGTAYFSGSVGIGASPLTPLHVKGAVVSNRGVLMVQDSSGSGASSYPVISLYDSADSERGSVGLYGNDFKVINKISGNLILATNNTTALTLDSSQRTILAGALRLNNAYTAGAPTATGYVTIEDSAGNSYKVLVGT